MKHAHLAPLAALSLLFCVAGSLTMVGGCSDDSPGDDEDGETPQPEPVGAKGVTIKEVAIYQSVKRQIMLDGQAVEGGVPLVAGRDAVIRVFYETNADYDGEEVTGRLSIAGADPIEVKGKLSGTSSDASIDSTVNFSVPGSAIGASLEFSLGLLEEGLAADDNTAAHYPAEGNTTVAIEGAANIFRVIIAPFEYNADNSGRLPDLSEASVEGYRNRLKQIYPVSDVEVTVRAKIPWNQQIDAFGNGWQEVGQRLFTLRGQDGTSDDVYYYGMFNPRANFGQYCSQGCLLGVTLLNDQPLDVGQVELRLALGVGYPEYGADTMAHELGHSHGREHADCGMPDQPDPQFPYPNGRIGVWGLDTATLTLKDPEVATDIMGYCDNQWVSDYTYTALFNRAQNVNAAKVHGQIPQRRVAVVGLGANGKATWGGFSTAAPNLNGRRVTTTITGVDGKQTKAQAVYLPWDHIAGGMALVPVEADSIARVQLEVDGVRYDATP